MNQYFSIHIKQALLGLLGVFMMISIASSCNHKDELTNDPEESKSGKESHNSGEDCMRCHHDNKNEASEKWWYVAGTVYESNKQSTANSGTVELWTGPGATGTFLYRMSIDKKGNFYTNRIVDFKGGYFPVVIHGSDTFAMSEKVTGDDLNKSCNSCHGHNSNGKNTEVINLN